MTEIDQSFDGVAMVQHLFMEQGLCPIQPFYEVQKI